VVPTKDYTVNSAWRQLSILAYNVARSFQLDTLAAPPSRARGSAPTPSCSGACGRAASCSSAGRPADADRGPPGPPPRSESGHGNPLWSNRSTPGRLTYFQIGVRLVTITHRRHLALGPEIGCTGSKACALAARIVEGPCLHDC
jgi:hypothetical protein